MDLKALRRRCEARLRDFPFPTPLNAHTFCQTLATLRGRPIALYPMPMGRGPSGLWLADDDTDHILFDREASALNQEIIVFHEASHIFCGHKPEIVVTGAIGIGPFTDLDLDRMRTVMARQSYSKAEDMEAEITATNLLLRSRRITAQQPGGATRPADPSAAALEQQLAADLEGDGGVSRW